MTPLKPLENLRVNGVMATRYQLNKKCAHPECTENAVDAHHVFPRSQIGNDFWFVEVEEWEETKFLHPLAHVTGLCRAHHDAVEAHDAWIKYEEGKFVWYDRTHVMGFYGPDEWSLVGPLNPQPGSQDGTPKKKKYQGIPKRNQVTYTLKAPVDVREDGIELLRHQIELAGETVVKAGLYTEPPPAYYSVMAALIFFNSHAGFDA